MIRNSVIERHDPSVPGVPRWNIVRPISEKLGLKISKTVPAICCDKPDVERKRNRPSRIANSCLSNAVILGSAKDANERCLRGQFIVDAILDSLPEDRLIEIALLGNDILE